MVHEVQVDAEAVSEIRLIKTDASQDAGHDKFKHNWWRLVNKPRVLIRQGHILSTKANSLR